VRAILRDHLGSLRVAFRAELLIKTAEELPPVVAKFGQGLAGLGLVVAVISARKEINADGVSFVTGTKAIVGVGLAVAGLAGAVLTAPAWGTVGTVAAVGGALYGIADYFKVVDYVLNGAQQGMQQTGANIGNSYQAGIRDWSNWHP